MAKIIKFLDLPANYYKIKEEIDNSIINNINNSQFIHGTDVQLFENEFAEFLNIKHCIGVANGTDALEIAINSLNFEPGTEIITQANTFIATALGISNNNLIPVFVDVNMDTMMIDHTQIEKNITPKTRAICVVHLYGTSPNMTEIINIATKYNLIVIEDCAQSHGSLYNDKRTGTFGDIACFSFYPGKNLGCYGDGGAIVINSDNLYNRVKLLHNLGSKEKYFHQIKGRNSRLDNIQAGILRIKLRNLEHNNELRRHCAKLYNKLLNIPLLLNKIKIIEINEKSTPVWHLFIIRVLDNQREKLQKYLKDNGIETGIHYPVPIHKQEAYVENNSESYPNTETLATEILSLPMYPELPHDDIIFICDKIKQFFM